LEAVASATVFLEREDPTPLLRFYNIFHSALLPYKDRMIVSDFRRTINHFDEVIAEVNERFRRDFALYEGSSEQKQKLEDAIRQEHRTNMGDNPATLPLPTADKLRKKQPIIERLQAPENQSLLAEAQRLYAMLVAAERTIQPRQANVVSPNAVAAASRPAGQLAGGVDS
jgi:hypothetical protein